MRRTLPMLIALALLAGFAPASSVGGAAGVSGEIRSLISRVTAAYGGKKALDSLESVRASGTIEAFMRGGSGAYELYLKRPRMLRVETKYRNSAETRILDGERGYRSSDSLPFSDAKGDSLLAMVYQYQHTDLPYGLMEGAYSARLKGKAEVGGRPAEVLRLTGGGGPPMDVYVDARTFLIVKVTGYFEMGGGRSTALSAEFSDFRKVGDTVFPFRITNYAGGFKIAETRMRTYVINGPMPASLFTP